MACNEIYLIPLVRNSKAKKNLLTYAPCTFCDYIAFSNDKINSSKRCIDCLMPFCIIGHHAKERCKRCYMQFKRNNATKGY